MTERQIAPHAATALERAVEFARSADAENTKRARRGG
jgi:hypothetical protein